MNLTGKWKGFYEYGYGYELPYFSQRVDFEIDISETEGGIKGTTKEKGKYAVLMDGVLDGFVEDTFISFVKKYPHLSRIAGNDEIEMHEGEPSHDIIHEGFVDVKNKSIYGEWVITETDVDEETGLEFEYEMKGIWLLEKMN